VNASNGSSPANKGGSAIRSSSGIWLVAEREIGSKLRSKAFVISTVILMLIALAGILIGGFASKNTDKTPIAVTSQTASVVSALPDVEVTEVADEAAAEQLVRDEKVDAAVVPSDDALGYSVVALKDAPSSLGRPPTRCCGTSSPSDSASCS
jgi:ABC-2 type transport system permease protein